MISRSLQSAKCILVLLLFPAATPPAAQSQRSDHQAQPSIGPVSQILPAPSTYRFANGQTYVLSVEWHFFNAGIARVKMEPAGAQQKVTAVADSMGTVNLLYGIHDRFESYFDTHSFCSLRRLNGNCWTNMRKQRSCGAEWPACLRSGAAWVKSSRS